MLRRTKKVALAVILTARYYLDVLIDIIFGIYYDRYFQPLKTKEDPLVLESAVSLAWKIREKRVTAEEVVCSFIKRIKEVNSQLNAVVDERFDKAVEEARKIDELLRSGANINVEEQPFLGVPFTTKESSAAKGLSHTFGLLHRNGRKADTDSDVIDKMKKAGAILIAVTNVPQLNLWQETYNPLYGTTNNPYDNTRTPGGSCGGEASIIAACGSPFGIGTDVAGSLRLPAFMCGVYGHKPTSDLISNKGLTIKPNQVKDSLMTPGPMTKYAADLLPILKVLVGKNIKTLKLDEPVAVTKIKVFFVRHPKDKFVNPFRSEMKKTLKRVLDHFEKILDDEPALLKLEELQYGTRIFKFWMRQDPNANIRRNLLDSKKGGTASPITSLINIYKEVVKILSGRSKYNMAMMLNLIHGFLPAEDPEWAQETTATLNTTLRSLLGNNGVLLYPSAPWPASYHHTALLRPWNFNLFSIWNVLKFPVTQVPLGLSKDNLPLGIQIVAAPYQDHLCIAVAKELEKVFGGYVPISKVARGSSLDVRVSSP